VNRSRACPPGCPYDRARSDAPSARGRAAGAGLANPTPGSPTRERPWSYARRSAGCPIRSQASCTSVNRSALPPVSGWAARSERRYARRSSSSLADAGTPSTSYGVGEAGLSGILVGIFLVNERARSPGSTIPSFAGIADDTQPVRTDSTFPAGSLNQAISGPMFCARPCSMPFSSVGSSGSS
jgi:hypothetical protein